MSDMYLASIIVNNYNYGRFLSEAIDSALDQTYPHIEVIVVDDGSTDNSRQIIAGYGDRVVPVLKDNGGQASGFNAGWRASHGQMIVFLDADDVLLPTAVETAIELFDARDVAKVHWPLLEIDEYGRKTGKIVPSRELDEGDLYEAVVRSGPASYAWPPTSGNAWARWFVDAIAPIPEDEYRISADVYVSALAPVYGRMHRNLEPQGFYRRHGRNNYLGDFSHERLTKDLRRWEHAFRVVADRLLDQGVNVDQERWKKNSWFHQLDQALQDIAEVVPAGSTMILIDENLWGSYEIDAERRCVPFPEHAGEYWGPPSDDEAAIRELERLQEAGATFMVFAWPAFWWLDHYTGLHQHLRSNFCCILESEQLVVFDLYCSPLDRPSN